ncbi:MAG: type I restriction-modification enzyme R subunit C-terminal domain-containing protein [Methylococcales bacterium]
MDNALRKTLDSRTWTTPQRQWLRKIAAHTQANRVVDCDSLDDPGRLFKGEGGGFDRLDRIFDGELQAVLVAFNGAI